MSTASLSQQRSDPWSEYFWNLSRFLERLERVANEVFAEYACTHVESCLREVSNIYRVVFDELSNDELSNDEQGTPAIQQLERRLRDLKEIVSALIHVWHQYRDMIASSSYGTCYVAPVVRRQGARGRPRLEFSRDQLGYLRSLSFRSHPF